MADTGKRLEVNVSDEDPQPPRKRACAEEDTGNGKQSPFSKAVESQEPSLLPICKRVLNTKNLGECAVSRLREEVAKSVPYPHGLIRELCNDSFLRAVRQEAIDHLPATFKETDLFKMYQTVDMANFQDDDANAQETIPHLLALRQALYSREFREFVQEVTGCCELSDKTDCAVNVHARGGHLLCHDDVIGNRAVSYIIYLVDPDQPWSKSQGGALELYPLADATKSQGVPALVPCKTILPQFNCMAFFNVLPGASYHAVQEVQSASPRMSIQGWYHAYAPPPDAERASLSLLQALNADDQTQGISWPDSDDDGDDDGLSAAEVAHLSSFINPSYLAPEALAAVAERFDDQLSVQLRDFLQPQHASAVQKEAERADAKDSLGQSHLPEYAAGTHPDSQWQPCGPPIKQRFLKFRKRSRKPPARASSSASDAVGDLLSSIQKSLFESEAFIHYLQVVTGCRIQPHSSEVRRFRPGLDYTVAHHGQLSKESWLSSTLTFVDDTSKSKAELWQSEEVGGFDCFLSADKDGEAATAEVYRPNKEEDNDLLSICAITNTLNLVLRGPARMHFTKYVSASAPGSRWDIRAEYQVAPESDA